MHRFALAGAAAIGGLLACPAGPAVAADNAETVLEQWTPAAVLPGDWTAKPVDAPEPHVIGRMTCTGRQRLWELADKTVRIGLRWYRCSDRNLMTAELDDLRRDTSPEIRVLGGVLGANRDVASVGLDAVGRIWVEGDYRIDIGGICPQRSQEACLELTGRMVRDLSAKLPGEPEEIYGDRQQTAIAWLAGTVGLWATVIGIVALFRRLSRPRLATVRDHPRWTDVGKAAKSHRRKMRLRRAGVLALLPFAGQAALAVVAQLTGAMDTTTAVYVVVGALCFVLPSTVLLVLSRDPATIDQLSIGREFRAAQGRRFGTAMLMLCGAFILAALVATFVVSFGGVRTVPLPSDFEALGQMMFFALFGVAWGWNRLVRHRIRQDVWASTDRRAAPPVLLLRGRDNAHPVLRAAPIYDRGPLGWAGRLLLPQRRQCIETVLAGFLARHAKIIALQPPSAGNHPIGPVTYSLPAQGWADGLRYAVDQAYAVVVVAIPHASKVDGLQVTREAIAIATEKPLLLVFPTGSAGTVRRHWATWVAQLGPVSPVAELYPALVTDATLVLAHLPGQGWFAWGAAIRDEWTYAEAVHDAMSLVTARRGASVAAAGTGPVAEGPEPAGARLIVAAAVDARVAQDVTAGLATMGVEAQPAVVPAELPDDLADDLATAVVMISDAALESEAWRHTISVLERRACRMVPVVVGSVEAAEVPEPLRALNWVRWDQDSRARAHAELFAAVNSAPSRYRVHRDLMSRARTWVDNNRSHNLLISDPRDAEAAYSHLTRSQHDPLARPNALLHDFVTTSLSRARQRGQRQRLWFVTGAVAAVLSLVVVTAFFIGIRLPSANNRLISLATSVPLLSQDRPDWAGLLAGALVLQGNPHQAEIGRRTLRAMLNKRWASFIGAGHDSLFSDMAMVHSGQQVLVVDYAGSLSLWDRVQAKLLWRRSLGKEMLTNLAADDTGTIVAASAGKTVHLIHPQPWAHRKVEVAATVTKLALSRDGTYLAAATDDNRI